MNQETRNAISDEITPPLISLQNLDNIRLYG